MLWLCGLNCWWLTQRNDVALKSVSVFFRVSVNMSMKTPWPAARDTTASPEHILPITAPCETPSKRCLSLLPYLTLYAHWLSARSLLFTCLKDKYPMSRVGQDDPRECPSMSSKVPLKQTGFLPMRQSKLPRKLQEIRDSLETGC